MGRFKFAAVLGVIALAASAVVLSYGCAAKKPARSENPFFDKWRARAEKSKGFTPSRKKTSGVSDRKKLGYASRAKFLNKKSRPLPTRRVTVKLREMDVSMVLRAVARAVGQNIIINESVEGVVSVDVKNVPWNQVFLGILKTQGLDYEWEGRIIRVMTAADKEKQVQREVETVIVPIQYAEAEDLQNNIQRILSTNVALAEEQAGVDQTPGGAARVQTGAVLVDKHNNALIIQASSTDIQRLLPIIETLDRPTAQVLIEAHIVEATKETARQLGVQWGGLYQDGNQIIYPGSNIGNNTTEIAGVGVNPTVNLAGNFPGSIIDSASGTGLTLGYMLGSATQGLLAAQLNALQRDGQVNILSSPSITTLDHHEAEIQSGKEVPYQTVDENGNAVVSYKNATLKLIVTPSVVDGEVLKLKIETRKDEVDLENTVLGNPQIITKNANTNVVLRDGETTVIGGLNVETERVVDEGIPGLMKIPILGWLFKSQNKSKDFGELLIFITPYILKEKTPETARR